MKTHLIANMLAFCFASTIPLMAQPPHEELESGPMRDKILAFKKDFLKDELVLDDAGMTKFWKVYLKYDDQKVAKIEEMQQLRKGVIALSDDQLKSRLDAMIKIKEDELEIARAYYEELNSVLSYRQILALFEAEHKMKREMLRRLKSGVHQGGMHRGRRDE